MRQTIFTVGFFIVMLSSGVASAQHSDVSVRGHLRTQVRAGMFATGTTGPSVFGLDVEFTPSLELVRRSERASSSLLYGLRVYSSTATSARESLLLLHQINAQHQYVLTTRASWQATAGASLGQVDYSRSLLVFDSESELAASRPDTPVIRFMNTNASTGINYRLSRRQQMGILGRYSTSRQLTGVYASGDNRVLSFPSSQTAGGQVNLTSTLTRKDTLVNGFDGGVVTYSTGPRYFPFSYSAQWSHKWSAVNTFGLQAGTMITVQDQFAPEDTNHKDVEVIPLPSGGARLEIQPHWNTLTRWTLQMSSVVSGYFDPILAKVTPRLNVGFTAVSRVSPQIQVQTQLAATSSLTDESAETTVLRYPATATARVSAVFDFTSNIQLTTGVGANISSTYPFSSEIDFSQRELMGFASLVMTLAQD